MSIASEIQALASDRTAIQNAISAKGGTVTSADGFDDFAAAIAAIPSGGTDISDTTATAADVRVGKYFYTADGTKTQGTIATYNGEHHSLGYLVSVVLTNPRYGEAFDSGEIVQINSNHVDEYGFYDDITTLSTLSGPTGSTTVTVSESALYLVIVCNGTGMAVEYYDSNIVTTAGITFKPHTELSFPPCPELGMANIFFEVTGNGTITIAEINWDDD